MNYLGITISFVIGGLLILSILVLNGRVMQNSGETVLNMSAKKTVENVREIMRRDFLRIGYNLSNSSQKAIQTVSPTQIIFRADIDNDPSTEARLITWRFNKPGNPVHSTGNPDDYELVRSISGSIKKMVFPLTHFNLTYIDKDGNETSVPSAIRSITVELTAESGESYNNGHSVSLWEQTFSPPNLKLQDMEW